MKPMYTVICNKCGNFTYMAEEGFYRRLDFGEIIEVNEFFDYDAIWADKCYTCRTEKEE